MTDNKLNAVIIISPQNTIIIIIIMQDKLTVRNDNIHRHSPQWYYLQYDRTLSIWDSVSS